MGEPALQRKRPPESLHDALAGDVFMHASTGAEIVVVDQERHARDLVTVQLNEAEGHRSGWISILYINATGWIFTRSERY